MTAEDKKAFLLCVLSVLVIISLAGWAATGSPYAFLAFLLLSIGVFLSGGAERDKEQEENVSASNTGSTEQGSTSFAAHGTSKA